jgi:hypothetical protein
MSTLNFQRTEDRRQRTELQTQEDGGPRTEGRTAFQQIAVRIDEKGLASALKNMSGPLSPTVDPHRVAQRKILHDTGQGGLPDQRINPGREETR